MVWAILRIGFLLCLVATVLCVVLAILFHLMAHTMLLSISQRMFEEDDHIDVPVPGWLIAKSSNGCRFLDTDPDSWVGRHHSKRRKPVVFFCHGLMTSLSKQMKMAHLLFGAGFHVIIVEYDIHEDACLVSRVDDVHHVWAAHVAPLMSERNPVALNVVGSSYGATVACHWLSQNADVCRRVDKVVLLNPVVSLVDAANQLIPAINATESFSIEEDDRIIHCLRNVARVAPVSVVYTENDTFANIEVWHQWFREFPYLDAVPLPNEQERAGYDAHVNCKYDESDRWLPRLSRRPRNRSHPLLLSRKRK